MRSQKVASEDVDQKLFSTFSELGYDGASMEILAKATGLSKASLYHRFPDGKKQMAEHVLTNAAEFLQENLVKTATDRSIKPEIRLQKALGILDQVYEGGSLNCLLRTLSVGTDAENFKSYIMKCFDLIAKGFAAIAIDMGIDAKTAKTRSKDVNLLVQGSLVLSGVTHDRSYFKNTLAKIPDYLTA
jgi:AcrR family transcriptional regulator